MRRSNVNDKNQPDQIMQTSTTPPPVNWRGGGSSNTAGVGGLNITRATNSPESTSASYTPTTNPSQKNATNLNTNTSSASSPNLGPPGSGEAGDDPYDEYDDQQSRNRQSYLSTTSSSGTPAGLNGLHNNSFRYGDKKKIGHRVVKDGVVHYKKVSTNELKKSIQFGIVHFLNEQIREHIDRDLLMQDFQDIKQYEFKKVGSALTPAHNFSDFKLKVYAPYGFKYLRRKFNVNEVDFMHSIGETDLVEIGNPGASGSVFYKTSNDKYIIKTVQLQECEFLRSLLAGYALNLLQNIINSRFTLLPTIFGLFMYQKYELTSFLSDKTNIRVVIMNNLLPTDVQVHEKFDLKGSLYKRKASKEERAKPSPTFKDLDFLEIHPEGLSLDEKHYENIISSIKRDCLVLESFSIMDYSLLLGIHNLEKDKNNIAIEAYYEAKVGDLHINAGGGGHNMDSSQSGSSTNNNHYKSSLSSSTARNWDNFFNISAVPARSSKGDRLLLYIGIIDILQSYRLKKRLEHTIKSMITDGSQISVCNPKYYASRFIEFMTTKVFKKANYFIGLDSNKIGILFSNHFTNLPLSLEEGEFKKYSRKIMAALALKSSPARKRLTFRMDNKSAVLDEASQLSPMSERASQNGDDNSASPVSTSSQSRRNTVESKPLPPFASSKSNQPRIPEFSTPTTPPPPIPAAAVDVTTTSKDKTFTESGTPNNKNSSLLIIPTPSPATNTSSLTNPTQPASQSTPQQANSSTTSFSRFNLKNLKPIDSVDSVSGLLLPKSDSKGAMLNKFSSHTEETSDSIDSSTNTTSGNTSSSAVTAPEMARHSMPRSDSNRLFKYANDNEAITQSITPSITPIIRHYEFKKSNENTPPSTATSSNRSIQNIGQQQQHSPANASSLAIRIQTHSPVQLLSSNSLMSHSASSSGAGMANNNSPLKSASHDQPFNVTYRHQTRINSYQIREDHHTPSGAGSSSSIYNTKDIEIILAVNDHTKLVHKHTTRISPSEFYNQVSKELKRNTDKPQLSRSSTQFSVSASRRDELKSNSAAEFTVPPRSNRRVMSSNEKQPPVQQASRRAIPASTNFVTYANSKPTSFTLSKAGTTQMVSKRHHF